MSTIEDINRIIERVIPSMEGWCSIDKAKRMARIVADVGAQPQPSPVRCVELGVFGGRGTVALALPVKHLLASQGEVFGIDPFTAAASLEGANDKANDDWWSRVDYPAVLASARRFIAEQGLSDIVRLLLKRSQDCVHTFADASIHVLHQDSNHSELVSTYEVTTWLPKMKPGGIWIQDDINWATTKASQDLLIASGCVRTEAHDTWAVYRTPGG